MIIFVESKYKHKFSLHKSSRKILLEFIVVKWLVVTFFLAADKMFRQKPHHPLQLNTITR